MSAPPVIFTDLDDTLFQTARKCPTGSEGLAIMSTLVDGSASGYATRSQQNFLSWIKTNRVIPVTARSTAVLSRVNISQAPAVTSNGGCIIDNKSEVDLDWHRRLVNLASNTEAVKAVYLALTRDLSENFRHWIVSESDLDLYVVVKSNVQEDLILVDLADQLEHRLPKGWRRHINGNNLAFLPPWLNKRDAVSYLMKHIRSQSPEAPIIGIGDSLSDVGFMDLCDFAMTPTQSQLWNSVTHESKWVK
ncbi:sucrose-6-phosphate hydrolase [Brevundimonas naejangsanensis]|uniref:sucrose-6-phosphate hydrolase n=1 Tax=Brevundimonas naejangsanensis TaxID=588932 RepID=UPI0026E99505|nr:sucrose-6-phosphate hydrolase [Brevundimonas naejangsanensis]